MLCWVYLTALTEQIFMRILFLKIVVKRCFHETFYWYRENYKKEEEK